MADVPTSPDAEMRTVAKFAWNQSRARLRKTRPRRIARRAGWHLDRTTKAQR
jgi:hypothetical protein